MRRIVTDPRESLIPSVHMKYKRPLMTCLPSAAFFDFHARSENRTRTGCPTRPSNVRVYQFRHPSLKRTCNYFAGEAAGLGEASGLAAAAGEVAGEAAGLADGAAAGAETGVGVGAAPSSTTE
jgi:hypothetical protein